MPSSFVLKIQDFGSKEGLSLLTSPWRPLAFLKDHRQGSVIRLTNSLLAVEFIFLNLKNLNPFGWTSLFLTEKTKAVKMLFPLNQSALYRVQSNSFSSYQTTPNSKGFSSAFSFATLSLLCSHPPSWLHILILACIPLLSIFWKRPFKNWVIRKLSAEDPLGFPIFFL